MVTDEGWNMSTNEYTSGLAEYKQTISRLFPLLPKACVDTWSISEADALTLGLLLDSYPHEVAVLDIGTFVGASAFFFAGHPKVTRVVSVDPNPSVMEEINDKSEILGVKIDAEPLSNLKVLDVARAALEEFPNESRKIKLHVGTIGTEVTSITEDRSADLERLEEPMSELASEGSLVAFVDGLHTREGVRSDLETVFNHNAQTVTILHDCRHALGPYVQAGVVSFMEASQNVYDFRLVGDLGPALATSNLGIIYQREGSDDVQRALAEFTGLYSERFDPLLLLRREEELIATVNYYKEATNEAARLQERNTRLEEQNTNLRERNSDLKERLDARISQFKERIGQLTNRISQLEQRNARLEKRNLELKEKNSRLLDHLSIKRYRIADAIVERLRWVPGLSKGARDRSE
jgi:hypothetical protein